MMWQLRRWLVWILGLGLCVGSSCSRIEYAVDEEKEYVKLSIEHMPLYLGRDYEALKDECLDHYVVSEVRTLTDQQSGSSDRILSFSMPKFNIYLQRIDEYCTIISNSTGETVRRLVNSLVNEEGDEFNLTEFMSMLSEVAWFGRGGRKAKYYSLQVRVEFLDESVYTYNSNDTTEQGLDQYRNFNQYGKSEGLALRNEIDDRGGLSEVKAAQVTFVSYILQDQEAWQAYKDDPDHPVNHPWFFSYQREFIARTPDDPGMQCSFNSLEDLTR